jgi:hypothetical protein
MHRLPLAAVAATAWPEREPLAAVRAYARWQGCGACGWAGRAIRDVLALASLSTSSGATVGRGSGAHNICAGHGSCARLLAAGGPKLGQGRRPSIGVSPQDHGLLA